MKTDIINGITRLTAAPGMVITNGSTSGTEVWLAKQESAANWIEATKPPEPVDPATLDPVALNAELTRYKTAVAEVTAINTSTALKTTLADAVNRLGVAVAPITLEAVK